MQNNFLLTPIEYVKGVGPLKADMLKKELHIFTIGDILYHFPFRYIDRSHFYKTNEIDAELPYIQLRGHIINLQLVGDKRRQRLTAQLRDDKGTLELVWFQSIKWVQGYLKNGAEYVAFGKPSVFNGKINIVHPELEPVSEKNTTHASAWQPVYGSTEKLKSKGLDSRGLQKIIASILPNIPPHLQETLPQPVIEQNKLIPFRDALIHIHIPDNPNHLKLAVFRQKFEELFFLQLKIQRTRINNGSYIVGHRFGSIGEHFNRFYKEKLPFELTNAQKRVLREIRADVGSGKQMNRLLQGDVGSGKTLVALLTMLMALDNSTQACLMAPTEILATQHYETISKLLEGLDISIALLTGNTKTAQRKKIHAQLEEGSLQILIGTHALIEDKVQFANLGMVVIDEQHRFGVEQRARLWRKNTIPPHILVMTATPIPRTLAMTLYGDLDVSIIDELPPGRKPVETKHTYDNTRLRIIGFMKEQIAAGKQIYVVFPLIEESETLDYKHLMEGYEGICRDFPIPQYQVSVVHGQMKTDAKDFEMQRFVRGETHIMVATTVIEVGVNVPNASVMIIESAERFGLSQLHQLRGRVGRGASQSYCILVTDYKLSKEAKIRMETMVKTNDGFEIADIDLKLRGPGDISGTAQSGLMSLRLADISKDGVIIQLARDSAIATLKKDPELVLPENEPIRYYLKTHRDQHTQWSRIS